jgi:hypothetical protein
MRRRRKSSTGEADMQTHEIHVSGAREQVHEIRAELFAFPEVIEVFVTGRPDFSWWFMPDVHAPASGRVRCAGSATGCRRGAALCGPGRRGNPSNTTPRSTMRGRRSR